ncbi:MAG: PTS system nitrogen regulatory IIA component [Oceanicoccus sp.]|jgi:PTS system nitrogen regulatory IIA component
MQSIQINSILTPGRTLCGAPGNSKKRVIENVAGFICEDIPFLDTNELFDKLITREKLGSTGLGHGIAIPHCRVQNCTSIIGTLVKLENAIDFEAIDDESVDLLFILLVPEQAHDEHLQVLATLAEKFSDEDFCNRLRSTTNSESLYVAAIETI